MKKLIISTIFILAMCGFVLAQSPSDVIEKVKEIKLLESSRDDVKKILADYELDYSDDEGFFQRFSKNDVDIEVYYSSGDCFRDEDEDSDGWKVAEWKVVRVEISFDEAFKIEDSGYDLSKFKKEQMFANVEYSFIYHNKNLGIGFKVDEVIDEDDETDEDNEISEDDETNKVDKTSEDEETGEENKTSEINTIYLIPSANDSAKLCDNNEEGIKFYASESWFGDSKLEDRVVTSHGSADVTDLILSAAEITPVCNDEANNENYYSGGVMEIEVSTIANDPENDVLTYKYIASGGEIIGEGSKVVWDLTGVEPGTYTITAGVDDGCGICGQTKTKEVTVKECPNPKEKQNTHFSPNPHYIERKQFALANRYKIYFDYY